jgi:(p)ppGpp synthase/HD superfamily hydrolase
MSGSDWSDLQAALQEDLDDTERARLQRAYAFAAECHGDTCRKDGSTILTHVVAVTANLQAVGVRDVELLAAGLLHDVVEKASVTTGEIEVQFGPRVAELVEAVTWTGPADAAASARKAAAAGDDGLLLRLCDRLDGVRRSPGRGPEAGRRFRETTRQVHLPLARERFPQVARALEQALLTVEP